MKLKRYVLLDNNRIVDRTKLNPDISSDYLMIKILAAIENEHINVCRQLVATSDEATDLIRLSDLVENNGFIMQVGEIIYDNMNECNWFYERSGNGVCTRPDKFYKLIGKDYICVYEKGEKQNERTN